MTMNRRQFVAASGGAALAPKLAHAASVPVAFPKGFLRGTATTAYQVEGNNINAANSFELWATDLICAE